MRNEIIPLQQNEIAPELVEATRTYLDAALAPKTRKLYGTAWRLFDEWCRSSRMTPMPASPETVALYLTHRAEAGLSVSTIQIDAASIKMAHEVAGCESPTATKVVRTLMRGIRRSKGIAPKPKAPVLTEELRKMVKALPDSNRGLRDAAVLLTGFTGAFRRGELVALDHADITFDECGVRIVKRRSKTDQEGRGHTVVLPYGSDPATCPVRTLRRWLDRAGIEDGLVFRTVDRGDNIGDRAMSGRAVARAIQRSARLVGIQKPLAGHSLRSGFCTSAAKGGASERSIMRQSGHRSTMMVRHYIRESSVWEDAAAARLGL